MTLDQETINEQLELLAAHRRTLAHLVIQAAQYGGEVFAPPQTANGIAEARAEIRRMKAALRESEVQVEDELGDEAASPVETAYGSDNVTMESGSANKVPENNKMEGWEKGWRAGLKEANALLDKVLSDTGSNNPSTKRIIDQIQTLLRYRNGALRIFLCHSSRDKSIVKQLYQRLRNSGFAPWLDEEDLLAGQTWELEIPKAIRAADVVLVCLSHYSTTQAGYVQKEIKFALDAADMQPEGTIFLIPLRLEECEVPDRLKPWHWVNLFEERGYEKLLSALKARAENLAKMI